MSLIYCEFSNACSCLNHIPADFTFSIGTEKGGLVTISLEATNCFLHIFVFTLDLFCVQFCFLSYAVLQEPVNWVERHCVENRR